jgi:hypothetical protein
MIATMRCEITYVGNLVVHPDYEGEQFDPETEIERCFERTMDELLKLGVDDPSVSGSVASGDVEISFTVTGADTAEAFQIAETTMRTVLLAAGIATSDWDKVEPAQATFELKQERRELVDA